MPLLPRRLRPLWISVALAVLTLAVFWPVKDYPFIELDDAAYLIKSPFVSEGLTPDGVAWAFTTDYFTYWHPVTWLSHMAAVDLYGMEPGGHHLVNLFLHLANVVLLFLVLNWMTGDPWKSGFAAALFAVHPLHVEPVAWVAARTDVLSSFFWILTMAAYRYYAARPRAGPYLLLVASFALGLMAKPMLATLPFALLLLDFWPLARFSATDIRMEIPRALAPARLRDLVREKIPLFALSAASVITTYATSSGVGSVRSLEEIPMGVRASNALVSYATYLVKTVWPSSLSIFYPYPHGYPPVWMVAGSALLLTGVSVAVFGSRRKYPYLPVGWLWYLGTLVPVIGLVQAGDQAAADRYTYIPLIGIFLAAAWGGAAAFRGLRLRTPALAVTAVLALAALAMAARVQVGYWRDSVAVFGHAIDVTRDNWLAHYNLGTHLVNNREYADAVPHFREAVRIRPSDAWSCNNLGGALKEMGRLEEAATWFERALREQPESAAAHYNLGSVMLRLGDMPGAIRHLREAVRIKPGDEDARRKLEWALMSQHMQSPAAGIVRPGAK